MMQDLPRAGLRDKQMVLFNIAPQIEKDKRDGDEEEAQCGRTRCGARAHLVHQAVAGLNPKAAAIFFGHLLGGEMQFTDDNIGEIVDAPPFVAPLAVTAHDVQGQGLGVIAGTRARVGGLIALPPHQGQYRHKGLCFQEGDNAVVIKVAIHIHAFHAQAQVWGMPLAR